MSKYKQIPDRTTLGEKYGPAMEITDQEDANAYFEILVDHALRYESVHTREEAEHVERSNLGYVSGYYDVETRRRVERLYGAAHPVFGRVSEACSPEEMYQKGIAAGRRKRE